LRVPTIEPMTDLPLMTVSKIGRLLDWAGGPAPGGPADVLMAV